MKTLSVFFILLLSLLGFAQPQKQPEFDKWVFSNNCSLDFSTGTPEFANFGSSVSIETTSSICSPAGDLLFYCDGGEIYDATNTPMPNSNIWDSNSARHGPIIVPFIDDPNMYYVFQVDGASATFTGDCGPQGRYDGLYYHVVDMTLNGGLGDIVIGQQNIVLVDSVAEGVIGIMHENGRDYWVITRRAYEPVWYAYLVTEDGICPDPVITDLTGSASAVNGLMTIAASFDGNQIATAEGNAKAQLIDFDRCTGELGAVEDISTVSRKHYDVAFSPNDSLIYTTHFPGTAPPTMFQYQRFAADISTTEFTMGGTLPWGNYPNLMAYAGMRVYGDTLYVGNADSSMHILATPDVYGAPGLENHWLYTAPYGARMSYNFPNYFDYEYDLKELAAGDTTICPGESVEIGGLLCDSPEFSYSWSPGTDLSADDVANPTASPTTTTTYIVTMTFKCMTMTDTVTVYVEEPASPTVGTDTTYCYADPMEDLWALPGSGGTIEWWGDPGMTDYLGSGTSFGPSSTVGTTTYYVTETTSCTSAPATVTITVKPLTIGTTKNIGMQSCGTDCDGFIVLIFTTGTPPFEVSWYDDSETLIQTGVATTTDTLSNLCAGSYTVVATEIGLDNCPFSATYNIISEGDEVSPPTAGTDAIYCFGDSMVDLTASGDGGELNWYTDEELTEWVGTGATFPPLTLIGETTYYVTQTEDDCESDPAEVMVTIEEMTVELIENIIDASCQGNCNGEIELTFTAGSDPFGVSWFDSEGGLISAESGVSGSASITELCSDDYSVVITEDGVSVCTFEMDFSIGQNGAFEVNFTGDNLAGCEAHEVSLTNLTDAESVSCTWDLGNGVSIQNCGELSYVYEEPGTYDVSLTVVDIYGCEGSLTIEDYVNVYEKPEASFTADQTVLVPADTEVEFTNTSVGGLEYDWDFGDHSPNSSIIHPTHNFPDAAMSSYTVQLTVTSENGCVDQTELQIQVTDEIIFYVPNVFTPDGNGYNEFFTPVFTSGYDPYDYHLSIFNRWGELVFESYDASIGWDGTYSNEGLAQDGVYVWRIDFKETMSDKQHRHTGHVTILK